MGIYFDEAAQVFVLRTANTEYQMRVNGFGMLEHLYYGARLDSVLQPVRFFGRDIRMHKDPLDRGNEKNFALDAYPQEYAGSGVGDYRVSGVETVAPDGSLSVDLVYQGYQILDGRQALPGLPFVRPDSETKTLEITMQDPVIGLCVKLSYILFAQEDVIVRNAQLVNQGQGKLILKKAASLCLDFFGSHFDLIHFHGRHCAERNMERLPLGHQLYTVASERGMSSHHHNPFVMLCDHSADEYQGRCYGAALVYSGGHRIQVEVDQCNNTRIVMGLASKGFSWELAPGASFQTPDAVLSFSGKGLNGLSQNFHQLIRGHIIPPQFRDVRRPILINNWEATYFDFNTEKILQIAQEASDLGIEMLVLDDGWFGKRNDDRAGLGDWFVNEEKLPGGLRVLSEEIHKKGLKFGLWLEPEMVNGVSELYEAHPDWALQDPGRETTLSRAQMVLDLSRQEVQDYLFGCFQKILEDAQIDYVKWDFNRSLANVYSAKLPEERQGEAAHRFMLGTYALLERLTTAYPDLLIEGCASGGGRYDMGMLYYCPQIWLSDNTDAILRIGIQRGSSYCYPVSTMGAHVSASPNHQSGRSTPIETRGIVAMSGTFGFELDPGKLSEREKNEIRQQIRDFRKYYWLIQKGTYFRLGEAWHEGYFSAWMFVSEDRSEALLNMVVERMQGNAIVPAVRLQGLDPGASYRVEVPIRRGGWYGNPDNPGTVEIQTESYSGAQLMEYGFVFPAVQGDYPAYQLHFVKEPDGGI